MSKQLTYGAAMRYTISQLGGFTSDKESSVTVGGTAVDVVIAQQNPDRVGLIVINSGGFDALVYPMGGTGANNGIRAFATGGGVSMNVRDDFTLPAQEWRAQGTGSTTTLFVIEFFFVAIVDVSE